MVASKNKKNVKAKVAKVNKKAAVKSKPAVKLSAKKTVKPAKKSVPVKKAAPAKKTLHAKPVKKAVTKAVKKIVAAKAKHVVKQKETKHVAKPVSKKPVKQVKVVAKITTKIEAKVAKPEKVKVVVTKPAKALKPITPKKCKKALCKEAAILNGYCRLHYITNWKLENIDKKVKRLQQLDKFISEIKKRFPAEYIDLIKDDLASDKTFKNVLVDMDLEEDINNFEQDDETQKVVTAYSNISSTTGDDDDF